MCCCFLSTVTGVRLTGGVLSNQGRVEVAINHIFGTVCDNNWSLQNAEVVCRMLNLPSASAALIRARFGAGEGPIWLNHVNCIGSETSLAACGHSGWGHHNCGHYKDAGVICGPPSGRRLY